MILNLSLIILFLIALNGLFVAAEFAIVSVSRTRMQQLADEGHRMAARVLRIKADARAQDQYIATAQLGITLASLGLGMYGEHHLAELLFHGFEQVSWLTFLAVHSVASAIAIAVMTYLHVVLGEMIPKTLALQKSERVVLWITPLMLAFRWLFLPLILLLNGIGNGLLKAMGIERAAPIQASTLRELQYVINQSHEAGALEKDTAEVLQELLAFTDTDAGELMVPRVHIGALALDSSAEDVRQTLMDNPHSRYPIYDDSLDDILGFVHLKDLYRSLHNPLLKQPVQLKDIHPLPFLPATAELETVLKVMHREQVRMAVLLDEYGGTAGLLTLEDIFAELVGPIEADELHEADIVRKPDGHLVVEGTTYLESLGEFLELELEHEEVETVSGLVLDLLERTPHEGDVVTYLGLQFKVLSVKGRGVGHCEVRHLDPEFTESEAEN